MGKEIAVHMRLDPTMSNMLTGLDETYGEFADVRGNIVVRLEKALCGCLESVVEQSVGSLEGC